MRHPAIRSVSTLISATTAAVALVSTLFAVSLTPVEEMNLAVSWPNMRMTKWTHGALLAVQYDDTNYPLIWILNRSGAHSLSFSIPGVRWMLLYDWDRGSDGTIGISGSAVDSDGRAAAFVAWISPDGAIAQIVRTGLYRPAMVAVAPDGTLWTVGKQNIPGGSNSPAGTSQLIPDPGVIQHFDRTGKTLGSFVPLSTIRNPLTISGSRNTLRVSKDRIAWYSVDGRYVEISLTGSLLTDIAVDLPGGDPMSPNIGFALTDEGDAFLSAPYPASSPRGLTVVSPLERIGIFMLDKSARTWKPVYQPNIAAAWQPEPNGPPYIYGVDGRRLVVMSGKKQAKFYLIGN
jgi:hypothetical protein